MIDFNNALSFSIAKIPNKAIFAPHKKIVFIIIGEFYI